MLFNNKVAVDRNQQKMYVKGREIIQETIRQSNENALNESRTINLPIGRASARRRLNAKKFKIQDNLTKKLFVESFFDLYKKSLLLDEDFILQQEDNLFNLCEETINNLLESGVISWDSIRNNGCKFTANLFALCEETAKHSSEKLVNMDSAKNLTMSKDALINEKSKEDEETVDEEDKKELDEKTEKDKEVVSKAVKDKVVETVKKEKEASEKEEEEAEEIKEKTKTKKEKEKEKEEDSDEEDTSDDDEEDDDDTSDEDSTEDDEETKSESFRFPTGKVRRHNKVRNESLFRSIQMNVANKFLKEQQNGSISEDVNMNMDFIFAESLAYYTLLETMNTIGILNMQPSDVKKLCKELIIH